MAVRTDSAQLRRMRIGTSARAKILQRHFGPPPFTAIRSGPMGHEHQTRRDSRQRPKPITTHGRPRHALRQRERILAPVVSAAIWGVEVFFGMSMLGEATDYGSSPLLVLLLLAYRSPQALDRIHQGIMSEGVLK